MAGIHIFDGSKLNPIEEALLILSTPVEDLFVSSVDDLPISIPEKFKRDNVEGFQCFDGSKLSPMEEATLILSCLDEDEFLTPLSTRDESEELWRDNGEGFQSFDGSKLNPMEEATLILNSPDEEEFLIPVRATEFQSFDGLKFSSIEEASILLSTPIDDLFHSDVSPCPTDEREICRDMNICSSNDQKKKKTQRLDETLKLETELLEIKEHLKVLGWLLESSIKKADMMLIPILPRQNVLVTC